MNAVAPPSGYSERERRRQIKEASGSPCHDYGEPTYAEREAVARGIGAKMNAISCEPVPGEFSRQGWVWRLTDTCAGPSMIVKMNPSGFRALWAEVLGCSTGWTGGRWRVPTIDHVYSTFKAQMIVGGNPALAALVYRPVEGAVLTWGQFQALPERIQTKFAMDLAEMAAAFHRHPDHNEMEWSLPIARVGQPESAETTLAIFLARLPANTDLSAAGHALAHELANLIADVAATVPSYDAAPLVLRHEDLNIQNLVLDDDSTIIGVFDFANAGIGRPLGDLRFLANASWELGMIALHHYAKITGLPAEHTSERECWVKVAVAALSGLVHRRGASLPLAIARAENIIGRLKLVKR